ncbi:MAG: alpha/beta hydrolase [Casimicrobiaceae bacterium]
MRVTVDHAETFVYTGSRALAAAQTSVMFVHGAALDHSVWALQSRYFAHHGFNALAVDLPGHGRSAGAPLASVDAIADWLVDVLDTIAVEQAVLVGYSMGALAALSCAARHGPRVSKLALLGPAVPMGVSDALLDAARADDHLAFELINGWSHSAGKQLGGNQVPGLWMTGASMRLLERSGPGVLHTDLRACVDYVGGLDAAAAVHCPSLVILGARDIMAPPRGAQALIAALERPTVVTLPDTGHAMMAEQPDAVLDALRSFV